MELSENLKYYFHSSCERNFFRSYTRALLDILVLSRHARTLGPGCTGSNGAKTPITSVAVATPVPVFTETRYHHAKGTSPYHGWFSSRIMGDRSRRRFPKDICRISIHINCIGLIHKIHCPCTTKR